MPYIASAAKNDTDTLRYAVRELFQEHSSDLDLNGVVCREVDASDKEYRVLISSDIFFIGGSYTYATIRIDDPELLAKFQTYVNQVREEATQILVIIKNRITTQ